MIWPVFVINMPDNVSRMEHSASQLDRLNIPFTRFDAVDGRALSAEDLARVYDPVANKKRSRHPMVGGEIGCYLSHVALWESIASNDAPGGIILEDDFEAADDFAQVLEAISSDAGNWEIAKLFSARKGQKVIDPRPLLPGRDIAVPYKVPNTTLGYAIRREAAARLAACALPMSRPIDEDHKHFWELGLRIALVTPSPLSFGVQSADDVSITATRRRAKAGRAGGQLARITRSLRYRLSYLFNLHWHRWIRRVR